MKNRKFLVINLTLLICLVGITLVMGNVSVSKIPQEKQATPPLATPPLENIKITLYVLDGDSSNSLHLVAQEKGYFNEAGCNLILRRLDNISRYDSVVEFFESDLYLMGRATVYAIEAAHPGLLKAFNFNLQDETRWNDAILVRKSLNITSLGQLEKNQSIGLLGGGPARVPLMKIMLKKNGLNPEDFKLISVNDNTLSGINIVYAREPFVSLLLAKGDWKLLIDEPLFAKYIFSPWPMSMSLFSTKFLKEKPALAQKVISVYDKTILFIREHPDEAQSILSKYVEKEYGVKGLRIRLINYLKSDEINKDLIQKQSDWYYENGMSSRKINAEDLIYTRELRE